MVLHSDGLTDRWSLDDYPGLSTHPPVVIAATLLRDAGRAPRRRVRPGGDGMHDRAIELLRATIATEQDVFAVRRQGRQVAAALGLEGQDQIRVATALSEVGRRLLGGTRHGHDHVHPGRARWLVAGCAG